MVRKIILQLLISIVIIFTLTSAFVFTIVQINKSRPEKRDKLYELSTTNDGLVQTIAYYLVKPILESALDHYIEKHGLKEYLKEITQQEREENSINFYEITEGSGSRALCGQEALLQMYKISNNLAIPLPSQVPNVTLKIGQDDWKEVGLGIMGMKEGGERVVTVNITNDNKTNFNSYSYYVKLIEVKDRYPDSVNNMMIFNDLINRAGKQVRCGDEVSIKYSVMGHNGEYVIKDQTAQFKVGDKRVPLAIELGVVGMRAGNNRTIISPPELLNVTDGMLIGDIDFEGENVSIINLSLDAKA
ncbi:MAG: FKBP-type peptidyl-prolyl cis-trans isomerase [Wolbachia sp.]